MSMNILLLIIPISLVLLALFFVVMTWAIRSGQYDDLDSPGSRILFDDDAELIPEDARTENQQLLAEQQAKQGQPSTTSQDKPQ